MNTFELKVWDDESPCCVFYTVQLDGSTMSETDKFFDRYRKETSKYRKEAHELLSFLLDVIGSKHGAHDALFRQEDQAQALPPPPKSGKLFPEVEAIGTNFPLRLYCYRVNNSIVILFDGGVKDAQRAQDASCSLKFREAKQFAKQIQNALNQRYIIVNDGWLEDLEGNVDRIIL